MATEKELNVRFILRNDELSKWKEHESVVLKKGEAAVVLIPSGDDKDNMQGTPPIALMKIGDGTTQFKNLPYLTAKAGDVYDWAKSPTPPAVTAESVTGLDEKIGEKVETAKGELQSKIEAKQDQLTFADGANYDGETNKAVTDTWVNTKITEATEPLTTQIADKQDKLTFADEDDYPYEPVAGGKAVTDNWVNKQISDTKDRLEATINGKADKTELTKITEDISGLKEQVGEGTVDDRISTAISDLDLDNKYAAKEHQHKTADVDGLDETLGQKASEADMTQAKADIKTLQDQVKGVASAMHFKGISETDPAEMEEQEPGTYQNGDVVVYQQKEFVFVVSDDSGKGKFAELGDTTEIGQRVDTVEGQLSTMTTTVADHTSKLAGISSTVVDYVTEGLSTKADQSALQAEITRADEQEKEMLKQAKTYTDEKIDGLGETYVTADDLDTAKSDLIGTVEEVSAQSIQEGVKEAEQYADQKITDLNISDYAKTSDVDGKLEKKADTGHTHTFADLVDDEQIILIFNGGTSEDLAAE